MKNPDIYDYEWAEDTFKDKWKEVEPCNIVAKFPMEQKVITSDGSIFAYVIDKHGYISWYYHGSIGFDPNNPVVYSNVFKKPKPYIP